MQLVSRGQRHSTAQCAVEESLNCDQHVPVIVRSLANENQSLGLGDLEIDYTSQSICLRQRAKGSTSSAASVADIGGRALSL